MRRLNLHRLCWLAALLACGAAPAHAVPRFVLPVDCTMGGDCLVQNLFDHDAAEGAFRDYACGTLGYDGHTGTDIRMRHAGALEGNGVDILAAADGRIYRTLEFATVAREDVPVLKLLKQAVMRVGCGEGLVIDHGTGWASHYCHLRAGSIPVALGQRVKAGEVIGKMGMTGKTDFPHLHFGISHYGVYLDPFVGHRAEYDCEDGKRHSLWVADAQPLLTYMPMGVITAGFSAGSPDIATARHAGAVPLSRLDAASAMGAWVDMFGLRKGDAVTLRLTAPDGTVLQKKRITQTQDAAIQYIALAAPAMDWAAGTYRAQLAVLRNGNTVFSHHWETRLTTESKKD